MKAKLMTVVARLLEILNYHKDNKLLGYRKVELTALDGTFHFFDFLKCQYILSVGTFEERACAEVEEDVNINVDPINQGEGLYSDTHGNIYYIDSFNYLLVYAVNIDTDKEHVLVKDSLTPIIIID